MFKSRGGSILVTAAVVCWILAAGVSADLGTREVAGSENEPEPSRSNKPVVVGSKAFTESRLLGEIIAQLIEAKTEIPVERRLNLGGTIMVFSALTSGELDIYPEYTGTAWTVQLKKSDPVSDPLEAYLQVAADFREIYDLAWLMPFGFANNYAMAMSEEAAGRLGITRISDLVGHQEKIRAGVSHEFLNRPDGFPGLSTAYGLEVLELRGMEHGLAYDALQSGVIDLTDTYTTDGKLLRYRLRLLEDDLHFFPPYDAAPIIRADTLLRYPKLEKILNSLAFTLDDQQMRRMNFRVEEEGGAYKEVARAFLENEGLLDPRAGTGAEKNSPPPDNFLSFLSRRAGETFGSVGRHLFLTFSAVFLSIGFAVPAGVFLTRKTKWAAPVLGAAGVIQTIPSLALLAFMIPIPGLGLGAGSAIAALFLYALLPILRNTYTGIREVDPELLEAARGMGLKDHQILLRVELPLSVRTIMAGIRTSTVISIGVATLAAFIGAGGLGDPIITGLQLNNLNLILSGAIPAALLAVMADFLLGRLEHILVPAGVRPVKQDN
jgi:osmoprotectant transport system permease protein